MNSAADWVRWVSFLHPPCSCLPSWTPSLTCSLFYPVSPVTHTHTSFIPPVLCLLIASTKDVVISGWSVFLPLSITQKGRSWSSWNVGEVGGPMGQWKKERFASVSSCCLFLIISPDQHVPAVCFPHLLYMLAWTVAHTQSCTTRNQVEKLLYKFTANGSNMQIEWHYTDWWHLKGVSVKD